MSSSLATTVQLLAKKLQERQQRLVTAESCTGGLIAQNLTDLAGSSLWFERGYVTYSNAAKQECLGVTAELLDIHGAVSEPVVRAMAQGALQYSHAEWGVAVTGIAGPSGGTAAKPVGLVWFAVAGPDQLIASSQQQFSGDRHSIRLAATAYALKWLVSYF